MKISKPSSEALEEKVSLQLSSLLTIVLRRKGSLKISTIFSTLVKSLTSSPPMRRVIFKTQFVMPLKRKTDAQKVLLNSCLHIS